MKKRLFCLFLCLVTVLSLVLTSCSSKTDDDAESDIKDAASATAISLSMWVVSDEKIPEDRIAKVTEAINAITKSKFKTQLVINYLTKAEYETVLADTISKYAESRKNQATVETETTKKDEVVTDETMTNELGMSVIKYPELLQNQVDIIYIAGEEMYLEFINKEWLAELDTELSSSSKKIREYVSATLLSAAKYNGTTYAIPNNRTIGQYNYMLLNKALMDKYAQDGYISTDMIDGLYNENLYPFLNLISMWEPGVIPIDASYEDCLNLLAHYWNINSEDYSIDALNQFSLFGYRYTDIDSLSRGSVILGYESLFANPEFVEDYLQLNTFRFKDYLRKESDETRTEAAVKFVTGDSTVLEKGIYTDADGKEYYPIVVGYPTATSSDIYGNMFGVCKYTKSVDRSMQIITYLNTNPDFRNLLQYGVEGVDYKLSENADKTVSVEYMKTGYKMDLYTTGNTFIAYHPEKGISSDVWDSAKAQNRSSLVNPLLGFDFASFSATTGAAKEEVKYNTKTGYLVSYTTGYSKYLLGQNATLDAWIKEADAAGKGVYVFKSVGTSGSDQYINYYVYNNNVSKDTTFTVIDKEVTQESTDKKGNLVVNNVGATFTFGYTGEAGDDYELSVVSVYGRKSHSFEVICLSNEEAVTPVVKEGALITLDFYNTKDYTIEIYEDLTKPQVLKNQAVSDWLGKCPYNDTTTGINVYQNGNETVYILYRSPLACETELKILPMGDDGKLNLVFDVTTYKQSTLAKEEPHNYLLYYVRITTKNENVKVGYTYNENEVDGENGIKKVEKPKLQTYTLKNDPNFELIGNLDTELVKFLETINTQLIGVLDTCYANGRTAIDAATTPEEKAAAIEKAIADYTALVKELSSLLGDNEPSAFVYARASFPLLYNTYGVTKCPGGVGAETFAENIRNATSYTITKKYDSSTGAELTYNGEPYYYYDSPYVIYYKWMQKFGFLPKETEKA